MSLYQCVDFLPYCNKLNEITGVDIDFIIMAVGEIFKAIDEGNMDMVTGIEKIEEELESLSNIRYTNVVLNTGEKPAIKAKVAC